MTGSSVETVEQYALFVALSPTVAKLADPDEVSLPALQRFFLEGSHSEEQVKALEEVVDAAAGKTP